MGVASWGLHRAGPCSLASLSVQHVSFSFSWAAHHSPANRAPGEGITQVITFRRRQLGCNPVKTPSPAASRDALGRLMFSREASSPSLLSPQHRHGFSGLSTESHPHPPPANPKSPDPRLNISSLPGPPWPISLE